MRCTPVKGVDLHPSVDHRRQVTSAGGFDTVSLPRKFSRKPVGLLRKGLHARNPCMSPIAFRCVWNKKRQRLDCLFSILGHSIRRRNTVRIELQAFAR